MTRSRVSVPIMSVELLFWEGMTVAPMSERDPGVSNRPDSSGAKYQGGPGASDSPLLDVKSLFSGASEPPTDGSQHRHRFDTECFVDARRACRPSTTARLHPVHALLCLASG